jgi:hypothetical protein
VWCCMPTGHMHPASFQIPTGQLADRDTPSGSARAPALHAALPPLMGHRRPKAESQACNASSLMRQSLDSMLPMCRTTMQSPPRAHETHWKVGLERACLYSAFDDVANLPKVRGGCVLGVGHGYHQWRAPSGSGPQQSSRWLPGDEPAGDLQSEVLRMSAADRDFTDLRAAKRPRTAHAWRQHRLLTQSLNVPASVYAPLQRLQSL